MYGICGNNGNSFSMLQILFLLLKKHQSSQVGVNVWNEHLCCAFKATYVYVGQKTQIINSKLNGDKKNVNFNLSFST